MAEKIQKRIRRFYSEDFVADKWESIKNELEKLLESEISDNEEMFAFIEKYSELSEIISDEMTWRYIKMTVHADRPEYAKEFNRYFAEVISPLKSYDHQIRKKYAEHPLRKNLSEGRLKNYDKIVMNDIALFRESNVSLQQEEQELSNQYAAIMAEITVKFRGEEKTLQQLSVFQKEPDRNLREESWRLGAERLALEKEKLNVLFDKLRVIRERQAINAEFENYRDYKHLAMGKFAYTPEQLEGFYFAVEKKVLPFLRELNKKRKDKLGVKTLRPWDMAVDLDGRVLKPFKTADELFSGCRDILGAVNSDYGEWLERLSVSGFLDLENRKGKAPGGYNSGLEAYGASFIFMNAVGLHRDVTTLLHESGHSLHSRATADISIAEYKSPPMEVAELASMSMELMTMPYWGRFYKHTDDLKKAKTEQLEDSLKILPWIIIVDAFQQWIYTHPGHSLEERDRAFIGLAERFDTGVDYSGFEEHRKNLWLKQLHIFEVPFYYIEYGMAQLGAIALYKRYRENPEKALQGYEAFMKLGYSLPVADIYKAAGIRFDFSERYIGEIVDFVRGELETLEAL